MVILRALYCIISDDYMENVAQSQQAQPAETAPDIELEQAPSC